MKRVFLLLALTVFIAAQAPATGKLVLFSDLAMFKGMGQPDNCILKNRFKKGEPVGWRITAVDGGTGQPETSAEVVVHVTYGGKRLDVPARYRGFVGPGPIVPNMWTAKWIVPADAPTGIVRYTVTAKDKYGRTAEFKPFPDEESFLTIVQ
jgi:hypothetical protein